MTKTNDPRNPPSDAAQLVADVLAEPPAGDPFQKLSPEEKKFMLGQESPLAVTPSGPGVRAPMVGASVAVDSKLRDALVEIMLQRRAREEQALKPALGEAAAASAYASGVQGKPFARSMVDAFMAEVMTALVGIRADASQDD